MKINSINSYNANANKNNNQTSFTALKGMKFHHSFNPQLSKDDAIVINAFKNSEPLKKFFERFDGYAEFSSEWVATGFSSNKISQFANMIITYNPSSDAQKLGKTPKIKNFFGKMTDKVKNFFTKKEKQSTPKSEFRIFTTNSKFCTAQEQLANRIKNLRNLDVERYILQNEANAKQLSKV